MLEMESKKNTAPIGLAALAGLLLVALMALGGLAVATATTTGGVSSLFAAMRTAGQQITISQPTASTVSDQLTPANTQAQQTAPAQQAQPGGVVDARTAVRTAGPAIVTVINMMGSTSGNGSGNSNPNSNPNTNPNGTPNTNPFGNPNGNPFGNPGQSPSGEALGSGIIIDSQGDILTNQHVVADQQSLEVMFADGTKVPATLVGQDTYSDIAVIKVNAKLPAVAHFGNSDTLEPGQPVVAIGTALGSYNNTVTEGIVSGLHRQIDGGGTSLRDLIQTDAAINHGNSGGALLDLNGNVVGINTAVVRSDSAQGDVAEGLGFAIPSNTAQAVAAQIMKGGAISHPFIGITYQVITPEVATQYNLSRQQGVYVTDVSAGSPAAQAGIVANSIITKFDGVTLVASNPTGTVSNLVDLLNKHKVGDKVTVTFIAPGSSTEKDVTITLAARPSGQ